jgi:hypothetical protein
LSIIQSKNIWMRKTACMSDYLEVEHGFEILKKYYGDEAKRDLFFKALDQYVPGAAQEAIKLFDDHLGNIRSSTYIASISEHKIEEDLHGRLSMWRAFCGNSGRVAIVTKIPWFAEGLLEGMKALNLLFSPVAYLTADDYNKEFFQIIENITTNRDILSSVDRNKIINSIFQMLLTCTVCLKHYGFKEEQEWRIMYFPNLWHSPLVKSETKVIGGVPQKIYKLPFDATVASSMDFSCMFERLIIGPTEYSWAMYEAFSEELSKIGVQDAFKRVSISGIPIRT